MVPGEAAALRPPHLSDAAAGTRLAYTIRMRIRAIAVAGLGLWALAAGADPLAWNQAEATTLANRFADDAEKLHEQIRKLRTAPSLGPITKDEMDLVELNARHLDARARTFASKLEEGQGRDETRSHWENIETTLRNVAEHGRSEWVTQQIYRTWADLRSTHLDIADYYGDHDVDPQLEDIRVEPRR
jgi:hypothetical protein